MHTPIPPSPSSADMSGIFHLDLDSPLAGQATPRDGEDETAAEDRVQDSAEEHEAAAVSAAESSPSQAPASTSSNAGAVLSPGFSVPWGRVAPSPDSSDALQGPWGRLQEVCVCVCVVAHVQKINFTFLIPQNVQEHSATLVLYVVK